MFFEMLILGTRDCIKLEQPEAYGDIAISSKDKLWEVCEGLNNLTVEAEVENQSREDSHNRKHRDDESRGVSPLDDAGETPTRSRKSKSKQSRRSSTPLVASSARSRRTVDMTM